jgi:hypothetical protein
MRIENVQPSDVGDYTCVVSNACASVETAAAALTISKLCAQTPSSFQYGTGKAGSAGVPKLESIGAPLVGGTSSIRMSNALPGAGGVTLLMGPSQASLPFDGGTLLVTPVLIFALPVVVPANGVLTITGTVPADPQLCGITVYHQMMYLDPSVPTFYHTVQTNGVARTFGSL